MKIILSIAFILFLSACEPQSSYEPESRPSSVPEQALWIGGADGGIYLEISKTSDSTYYSKIYFDSTGEIWFEGNLTYEGNKALEITNPEIFSFWDGDSLYLVNNEKLSRANN